ncbi:MAG: iron-sulfur cluster assembly scaffold protein [Vigna little leaf phytoplasma]|nr:iron-sulfur cluster assembly scaffold protein [Vigna little leaf phytoplasma]
MNINEIYREIILKYANLTMHQGLIPKTPFPNIISRKENKICGESIILQIFISEKKLTMIKYKTKGCAILVASSSLMSIFLKNLPLSIVIKKINHFLNMINNKHFDSSYLEKDLLSLKLINNFPGRLLCATIPWELLLKMIQKKFIKKTNLQKI